LHSSFSAIGKEGKFRPGGWCKVGTLNGFCKSPQQSAIQKEMNLLYAWDTMLYESRLSHA
jgi:hypothetical protein